MNIDFPLVMVQALLAMMLVWSCFCRLVKTDLDTERELRWVIVFEGMAAGLVLLAPWLPLLMPADMHWQAGTTPAAIWLLLLLAATLMQLVKAKFWKDGRAPEVFQKVPARTGMAAVAALMALGLFTVQPQSAAAQDNEGGQWREIDGDSVYLPPGAELRCDNAKGCFAFTADALRALLEKAGGTCGRIPPLHEMVPKSAPGRSV